MNILRTTNDAQRFLAFFPTCRSRRGSISVLASFSALRSDGLDAKLILAGPIVDPEADALLRRAKLEHKDFIIDLGPVSGAEKDAFFRQLDFFLFPSKYCHEAQPLVVLEALSYGIPSLVTRHGYIDEIVDPLGTAVNDNEYVAFVHDFIRSSIADSRVAKARRTDARMRFIELKHIAERQEDICAGVLMDSLPV